MLDPQSRALIDLMVERGVPAVHTLTPAEARRYYLERRFFTQPEPPAVGDVQWRSGWRARVNAPREGCRHRRRQCFPSESSAYMEIAAGRHQCPGHRSARKCNIS